MVRILGSLALHLLRHESKQRTHQEPDHPEHSRSKTLLTSNTRGRRYFPQTVRSDTLRSIPATVGRPPVCPPEAAEARKIPGDRELRMLQAIARAS